MAAMKLGVLGALEIVDHHGDEIVLASAAQRRLLAVLLTNPGSVVSVDRLSDTLGISTGGLHTAVSRLRKSLGADVVVTEPPGYALRGIELDAAAFEAGVERARSAQPEQRIEILAEALALWRGDAFLGFADEEWARGSAVRLSELRATATEDHAEAMIVAGRCSAAVAALVEHIDRFPLRDRPRGLLMRGLAAQGRQSEALRAYQSYRTYLGENIGTEPSAELSVLERKIASGWHDPSMPLAEEGPAGPQPTSTQQHNLRPDHNEFIDRPEVTEVLDMLGSHRLVTIVGPGGMGKSRVSRAAGQRVVDRPSRGSGHGWADGVWFVDLAPLRADGAEVARVVAEVLGLQRHPGLTVTDTVIDFLRDRDALLILDNCEHVLDSARDFVAQLVSTSDSVGIVATSRVRLGLESEQVVGLEPLSNDAALRLFDARVAEIGAGPFPADDGADLCAVLDNYPLAIELAAGRCRALTAAELSARLSSHPGLLRARSRAGSGAKNDRHSSLTAALDWSLAQLDPSTRALLERAAMISSDFDLDAAEAILPVDGVAPTDVIEHLEELVEHHLVRRDHQRGRFRILEPIRQIVRSAATSDSDLARRHGTYYVSSMTDIADGLFGPEEARWLARLHDELPNVRDAVDWAISHQEWARLELMMQKMPLVVDYHVFLDPADWAERMLEDAAVESTRFQATALTNAVGMLLMERFEECDELLGRLEASGIHASMISRFCLVRRQQQWNRGDAAAGFEWADRCVEAARADGDRVMIALGSMGVAEADATGNPSIRSVARGYTYNFMDAVGRSKARQLMEASYAAALESTNPRALFGSELLLGAALIRAGDVRRGALFMAAGIERGMLFRSPMFSWIAIESVANSLVTAGEAFAGRVLWAAVEVSGRSPMSRTLKDPTLAEIVDRSLSNSEVAVAQREGAVLTMDTAAAFAQTALEKVAGEPVGLAGLDSNSTT